MFCIPGPNLVILTWMSDELSCGQVRDWHTHWHWPTDAADDNTRRPKLASGKKEKLCKCELMPERNSFLQVAPCIIMSPTACCRLLQCGYHCLPDKWFSASCNVSESRNYLKRKSILMPCLENRKTAGLTAWHYSKFRRERYVRILANDSGGLQRDWLEVCTERDWQ